MPVLLIADDHPLLRDALRTTVQKVWPDAQVHEADSVATLYALVERERNADLLLDLGMPGAEGFEVLIQLRARYPQLPVAIVSAHENPASMRRAMDHGALGFIPKSSSSATLAQAAMALNAMRAAPSRYGTPARAGTLKTRTIRVYNHGPTTGTHSRG